LFFHVGHLMRHNFCDICMIVSSLTTTGRSTLSVWNKSKSSNHLKHSHLCFGVCCLCCLLSSIQNPSSDIFAQRDQHENYCSVRFCLATSEPIECCYRTKPGIGRGRLHCARWVDQISFTNVVLFIKSPFEIHDGTKSFLDYRQQCRTRCPAENPLRCFHENNGNGFAGRCFVV
jgi:hypothetical protein